MTVKQLQARPRSFAGEQDVFVLQKGDSEGYEIASVEEGLIESDDDETSDDVVFILI